MLPSICVVAFASIAGFGIWRKRTKLHQIKEAVYATVILITGTIFCVGMCIKLPIPNPADWIQAVYAPLMKPIVSWVMKDVQQ